MDQKSGEELLRRIVRDRRSWWEESQLKAFKSWEVTKG